MEGNTKKELGDILKKMDRLSKDVNLIEENISRLADKIGSILLPERPAADKAADKDAKESSQLSYRIDKIDSLLQVLNERLCDIIDRAET